jgi:8-oxo-dGDP phosphatase
VPSSKPLLPQPWVTLSSKTVFEDRWLRLQADECLTAEGRPVSPYYVLETQDYTHIAAITPSWELVAIRQYRQGSRAVHLELPAGVLDREDDHALAGAKRELLEETGFSASFWQHLATWHANPARQSNRHHLFLATGAEKRAAPVLDGHESLVTELIPVGDLMSLVLSGGFDSLPQVASVLRVLAALGVVAPSEGVMTRTDV